MPIQQGNHLDPAVIAQVKPGMTRTQVRYLLGTPMVPRRFDNEPLGLPLLPEGAPAAATGTAHATVYFKNDLVDRVETDVRDVLAGPLSTRPVAAPNT